MRYFTTNVHRKNKTWIFRFLYFGKNTQGILDPNILFEIGNFDDDDILYFPMMLSLKR